MKLYLVGGSEEEIKRVQRFCQENGWGFRVVNRIGRPKANYPVQKVLDAYERVQSIRGAANLLSIPPGTVYGILKRAGIIGKRK